MIDEFVEILTEDGTFTGKQELKSIAHKHGMCHGISAVALINKNGKLLIQKRASTKKNEPNKWDLSGAGHMDVGERPQEAAIRELYEELGVKVQEKELKLIDTYLNKVQLDSETFINHFTYLFILEKDISLKNIVMKKSEVSNIMLVDKQQYCKLLKAGDMVMGFRYCGKLLNYIK